MPIVEVGETLEQTWVEMKFRLVEEDHRSARRRVPKPEVAVQNLFFSGAQIIDVVTLAVGETHRKLKTSAGLRPHAFVLFVREESSEEFLQRLVEVFLIFGLVSGLCRDQV